MNPKILRWILSGLLLLSTPVFAVEPEQMAEDLISRFSKSDPAYLFTCFTGEGEDGIGFLYSFDGLYWQKLNEGKTFLHSYSGKGKVMQDPSITRDSKGVFHVVWTTGRNDKVIGYSSSRNLINWSEPIEIPVMENEPLCKNCWAPEVFFDKGKKLYYIVWASTVGDQTGTDYNHKLYYTTTKDYISFAKTKLFLDLGYSSIDPFLLKQGCKTYLICKRESDKPEDKKINILTGKLLKMGKSITSPIPPEGKIVGPSAIQIGKFTYIYWRDSQNGAIRAYRCAKLKKPVWEDVSDRVRFPGGVKPGTPIIVEDAFLKQLQKIEQ
jgi:hypothetical protein